MNFTITINIKENFTKKRARKLKEILYALKIIRRPVPLTGSSIKGALRMHYKENFKMY